MAGGMADHQKHRQRPEAGQPGRPKSANLEPGHLTDLFDASRVRPFLFDRQRSCPKHFLSQTFESFHRWWSHFFAVSCFFLQSLYLQSFFLSHDQIKTLLKSLKLFCFNLFFFFYGSINKTITSQCLVFIWVSCGSCATVKDV